MSDAWKNDLAVSVETSFGAGHPGTPTKVPGKLAFNADPVRSTTKRKVDVWRRESADAAPNQYWRGALVAEHSHTPVLLKYFRSVLTLLSATAGSPGPGYTTHLFAMPHAPRRESLAFSVNVNPAGPFYTYKGVILTGCEFTILRRGSRPRMRFNFVAAERTVGGGATTMTDQDHVSATHMMAIAQVGAVDLANVTEATFRMSQRVDMAGFNSSGVPTDYSTSATFRLQGEFGLRAGDTVLADLVNTRAEAALNLGLDIDGSQRFELISPRTVFTRGAPPTVGPADMSYRVQWGGLIDTETSPSTETKLNIVLPT